MNIVSFVASITEKSIQIYNQHIRNMYDSIRTTGIYALSVHCYTQIHRKSVPLANDCLT